MPGDREDLELLGRELADYRIKAGLTQATVGTSLGVSRHTVAQWERGSRGPTYADLCRMCDLFGVPVGDLVGRALGGWIPPTLDLEDVEAPNYESQTRRSGR